MARCGGAAPRLGIYRGVRYDEPVKTLNPNSDGQHVVCLIHKYIQQVVQMWFV
jgi:hypothetical protein